MDIYALTLTCQIESRGQINILRYAHSFVGVEEIQYRLDKQNRRISRHPNIDAVILRMHLPSSPEPDLTALSRNRESVIPAWRCHPFPITPNTLHPLYCMSSGICSTSRRTEIPSRVRPSTHFLHPLLHQRYARSIRSGLILLICSKTVRQTH